MTGWIRFTTKGERGTKLRFKFGEMLNDTGAADRANDGPGGSLYTYNLRTAEATLHYTLKGTEEGETFQPSTTFFGFRYCEVTTTSDVEISKLTGEFVGSDLEELATFETSHPDINQLYSNHLEPTRQFPERAHRLPATRRTPRLDGRHTSVRTRGFL
jgi:alpha-L-rhamnosidase